MHFDPCAKPRQGSFNRFLWMAWQCQICGCRPCHLRAAPESLHLPAPPRHRKSPRRNGTPPAGNGCRSAARTVGHRGEACGVYGAAVAVQRNAITLVEQYVADAPPAVSHVDVQRRAGDQAHLAKLARHHRRVGRASTCGGENAGSDGTADGTQRGRITVDRSCRRAGRRNVDADLS